MRGDGGLVIAEMCETHAPHLAYRLQVNGWSDGVVLDYPGFLELAADLGLSVDEVQDGQTSDLRSLLAA
jgi:hypothetical protein